MVKDYYLYVTFIKNKQKNPLLQQKTHIPDSLSSNGIKYLSLFNIKEKTCRRTIINSTVNRLRNRSSLGLLVVTHDRSPGVLEESIGAGVPKRLSGLEDDPISVDPIPS